MENRKKIMKIISLFGVMGVVFYFMHIIFGRIFYEAYNPFSQAISDLTAENSPSRNIAFMFSFIYGVFNVIFCICFCLYFRGKINKIITIGSYTFCIMNIISFLGYTFFPLSQEGYAHTFQDKMHLIVTVFVVVLTITSIAQYSIGFLKSKELKILGIISICTFLLLVTGAMLINILPREYFGIGQRINVYSIITYTGILSVWMFKYVNKNGVRPTFT